MNQEIQFFREVLSLIEKRAINIQRTPTIIRFFRTVLKGIEDNGEYDYDSLVSKLTEQGDLQVWDAYHKRFKNFNKDISARFQEIIEFLPADLKKMQKAPVITHLKVDERRVIRISKMASAEDAKPSIPTEPHNNLQLNPFISKVNSLSALWNAINWLTSTKAKRVVVGLSILLSIGALLFLWFYSIYIQLLKGFIAQALSFAVIIIFSLTAIKLIKLCTFKYLLVNDKQLIRLRYKGGRNHLREIERLTFESICPVCKHLKYMEPMYIEEKKAHDVTQLMLICGNNHTHMYQIDKDTLVASWKG
jgi:hypothetical protein